MALAIETNETSGRLSIASAVFHIKEDVHVTPGLVTLVRSHVPPLTTANAAQNGRSDPLSYTVLVSGCFRVVLVSFLTQNWENCRARCLSEVKTTAKLFLANRNFQFSLKTKFDF